MKSNNLKTPFPKTFTPFWIVSSTDICKFMRSVKALNSNESGKYVFKAASTSNLEEWGSLELFCDYLSEGVAPWV